MKVNKKLKIAIIIAVLALGAFLRFNDLGEQSYWMDEGYTINAVISGHENGFDSQGASILDSGKTYACQTYCLPTIGLAKIFGNNAVSYRLLAAIFGLLFVFVIFSFAKNFFKDKNAALLSAFFVALSYWQIAWSREARWYTEFEVFFWLALSFFYLSIKNQSHCEERSDVAIWLKNHRTKRIILLSLSILFTILAVATHKLAYLLPIIMLIWYVVASATKWSEAIRQSMRQKPDRHGLILIGLAMTTPFLIATAIILFIEYVLGFHFITNALPNITFHYNLPYYLSFYLRNYWPFIIISIYGLFSAQGEDKKKHLMLWSAFLTYLIPLSIATDIVHYRYMFHLTPIFYLAAAYTIINIQFKNKTLKQASIAILIAIFFLTGQGLLYPKSFYTLESDDPTKLNRPYYAYTPQPNWNKAYEAIKENIKPDEAIISSHPHFNKIFLNQPGYWIRYDYLGIEKTVEVIKDNKEYYVGAEVINNLEELKKITQEKHGYIIFDYQAADGRIAPEIVQYIQKNLKPFFYDKINSYSQIWVYKF